MTSLHPSVGYQTIKAFVWIGVVLFTTGCGDRGSGAGSDSGVDARARDVGVTDDGSDMSGGSPGGRCSTLADCPPVPPGLHPCVLRVCDAATTRCLLVAVDADGDGAGDAECPVPNVEDAIPGADCDDTDPRRYPGRNEICDSEGGGHDEDCDTTTVGDRDADGDLSSSFSCCNLDVGLGETVCGPDCDDSDPDVHPRAADGPTENCDGVDNNCDGVADLGCLCTADILCGGASDGLHNEHPATCRRGIQRCEMGVLGACVGATPATVETCAADGLDEDCDGEVNEPPCECVDGMERSCGLPEGATVGGASTCVPGRQRCVGGLWDACAGAVPPGTEICDADARDEDCDGTPNQGCDCIAGSERPCGMDGVVVGGISACRPGIQRCDGGVLGPCVGAVGPSDEVCDSLDNDCDGVLNEEPEASSSCTAPMASASCEAGACVVECAAPLADCDGDPVTGCEVYLRTDTGHCGACNHGCVPGEPCAAGFCDPVVQLAAGRLHTCALRTTGRVFCWGANYAGECGAPPPSGGLPAQRTPIEVPTLNSVVQIVAGDSFTCARRNDRTVWCWGDGSVGQLGGGTFGVTSAVPVMVPGLTDVARIAAGVGHVCAVLGDSSMRCWGWNSAGQLGDGTTMNRATPTRPLGPSTWFTFSSGGSQVFARDAVDRDHWSWGDNTLGQLGDGTTSGRLMPGPASFNSGLSIGALGSCEFLEPWGNVRCWGAAPAGDGSTGPRTTPVTVGVTGAAGTAVGWSTRCAWLMAGGALCWGRNAEGQVGVGTFGSDVLTPTEVSGLADVREIALGQYHSCARIGEGAVRCWGRNDLGELGNGGMSRSAVAVATSVLP